MQPDLKRKIEASAKLADRSINAELVARLESSFVFDLGLGAYTDGALIDELVKRWGRDACYIRLGEED